MMPEPRARLHLTKEQRLPKSYKEVEKILNIVKKCEANVKTVLNNSKLRGAVLHKVSGLTFNVLKQRRLLDSIIERTKILEKEPYLRKELAGILIHELIFSSDLPGKSKPVETILRYQVDIKKAYDDLKSDDGLFKSLISIPKYVRVNTLEIALPEVLEDLEYSGVKQIVFDASISEEEFYELVKNLEKNTFLLDYHFKDLLVFNAEENLTTWSLYQKGHVFIQDKSSYIPAYVLAPPPGATVIDACAAPGMKTLHLTALMENNGVVYAFERDQQRFEILRKMLKSGHANICQTFCGDFNLVDPRDEKYSSVEYILLDPSCSGSGMVNRMDYITDTKESKNDLRIQKLAGFQIILLKHALLFPSVKRVVYSTCSVTEIENEYVVHEVLNHFSHRFKLSPVLPDWSIRGSNNFEFGSHCLRAYPDKCFTNGFFVAMFERIEDFKERHYEKKQRKQEKKKHSKDSGPKDSKLNYEGELFDADLKSKNEFLEKGKCKNHMLDDALNEVVEVKMPRKKKHKKHENDILSSTDKEHTEDQETTLNIDIENNDFTSVVEETKHKKKHKSKHNKEFSEHISENDNLFLSRALESERKDSNIQNNILVNDIQEINLKPKKHKRKHNKDFESNTYPDTIVEETKHQKKHKSKHNKEYPKHISENDNLFLSQAHASERKDRNIQDCILVNDIQEINLKPKGLKRKHNKDFEPNTSPDNTPIQEVKMSEVNPHKKKNKHGKNSSDNSFSDTHATSIEENALDLKRLYKKKKQKKQHEKEDSNNSFCETQNPEQQIEISNVDGILIEAVEKIESSHKKKKKRKSKHEKEYDTSFYETQTHVQKLNLNVEANTLVENSHKRKHEIEINN